MLLSAKYVFPIIGDTIRGGAVLVKDDKIADIGDLNALTNRYPEEEIRDFGTAALLPGFVDLNTRLEMAALRGVVADVPYIDAFVEVNRLVSKLDVADWEDSAVLGALDALSTGITTIGDISSTGASLRAAQNIGLRGVIYREVGAMDKNRIERAMNNAEEDIKKWRAQVDSSRIQVGISPVAIYANHPAVFRAVSDLAIRENLPVALRIAGSRDEYNFVMYGSSMFSVDNERPELRGYVETPPWLPFGVTPIRYALNWGAFDPDNVMIIYGVHVNDADLNKLRDADVSICVCPNANAVLGMGVAPLSEYINAEFRVGLGTDSPAATDSTDMFNEMRIGLLMNRSRDTQEFVDSMTMLELATIGGARALKMEDKIGSLEVGKCADIIAVDLSGSSQSVEHNPVSALVNTSLRSDLLMTMVDGKILYEKNQWNLGVETAHNVARIINIRAKLKS